MTKENELVVRLIHGRLARVGWGVGMTGLETAEHLAEGLADAGLLSTPAMRASAEACKRLFVSRPVPRPSPGSDVEDCWDCGRALLAEEAERAPKPRWVAQPYRDGGDMWFVGGGWSASERPSEVHRAGGFTQQQAEVVAQALNSLSEREGW